MTEINRVHALWSNGGGPLIVAEQPHALFDRWVATRGAGCCDLLDVVKS